MKLISNYIKPLWFSIIIVSLLSLLNVAGTLYIPAGSPEAIMKEQ